MTERKRKIEAAFHAAMEIDSLAERERYLNEICANDPDLRREVDELLRSAELADAIFKAGREARREADPILSVALTENAGDRIGRYKLLQKIGEGGMGVVYMAEQERPVRRKVALKIIKLGMNTRQVVARFEAERQALAMMDHPNIAGVLDGGATDAGRPFFVMELVQGVPITEFCKTKGLFIEERLKLFVPVCQAIQSAHQKGIIHRDIKPSNVLVTMHNGVPHPMVIDFGVAKAIDQKLTEKTLFTNFATMIGTPAYMSPEQAQMSKLDVDTRSDIYSLGVLLYELLTGTTPFPEERLRSVAYGEMQRIIAEEESERPSTRLKKKLAAESRIQNPESRIDSDLDWIVMKCLEKDRNRRYETASAFAADIQYYLKNEPVIARPPSTAYRLRKFIARRKLEFSAAMVVLVSLIAAVVVSSWQAARARRAERQRTEELGKSLLAFARASRQSGEPGRRSASLEAITKAAAIHRPLELRNEAIAALALTDLGQPRVWQATDLQWEGNCSFDSDLERYAVWRPDKAISICRVSDQHELFRIPPADSVGRTLNFSPDGKWLAVRHEDGFLRVWDLEHRVNTIAAPLDANLQWSLDFSPNSQHVVAGATNNWVRCFEVATGVETNSLQVSVAPAHLLFNPVGKLLAIHDGDRCELWDWKQRKLQRTLSPPLGLTRTRDPGDLFTAWEWHPDGIRFATGSHDEDFYLWDTRTGNYQILRQPNRIVVRLIFSPLGDLLVSHGWDSTTRVRDAQTGQPMFSTEDGYAVRFSRDGQRLAFYRDNGELGVWPVVAPKVFRTLNVLVPGARGQRGVFGGCQFSPDGRFLVWGQDHGLRWLDLVSGAFGYQDLTGVRVCAFGPDGDSLLTVTKEGGREVGQRWPIARETNAASVRLRLGSPTPLRTGSGQILQRFALSQDGQTLVGGTRRHWTVVAPGEAERVMEYPARFDSDYHFMLSPDQRWVGLGFWRANAFVCDARNGEPVKEFPDVRTGILAFTPDGRWLVTCSSKEYQFWQTGTWEPGLVIRRELASTASGAIAFGLEGKLMAIARTAYSVQLLNPNNGEVLADLTAPNPLEIHRLCFNPDGSVLAVTGMEGIHLWDLRALRRELAALDLDWKLSPYPPGTNFLGDLVFRYAPDEKE